MFQSELCLHNYVSAALPSLALTRKHSSLLHSYANFKQIWEGAEVSELWRVTPSAGMRAGERHTHTVHEPAAGRWAGTAWARTVSHPAPSQPDLTGRKGRVWKRPGGVRHRTQGKLREAWRIEDVNLWQIGPRQFWHWGASCFVRERLVPSASV